MLDLNLLIPPNSGWALGTAVGINDLGQITGVGSIGGQSHAYTWAEFKKRYEEHFGALG